MTVSGEKARLNPAKLWRYLTAEMANCMGINIKTPGAHHIALRSTDEMMNKRYVAFKNPDRISWEFFMV